MQFKRHLTALALAMGSVATFAHVTVGGSGSILGLVLGAWCLVLGAWCLVLGAWCLVLGALIMQSIDSGMLLLEVPIGWRYVIIGQVLIAAVVFDVVYRKWTGELQ
jgi:D-xylose transport system permease protein